MSIMAKEYTIKNYEGYGLGLRSEREMLKLLNILDLHNETLESLHDAYVDNTTGSGFCGIYMNDIEDIEDIVRTLFEYHAFFDGGRENPKFMEYIHDEMEVTGITEEELLRGTDICDCEDGVIILLHC